MQDNNVAVNAARIALEIDLSVLDSLSASEEAVRAAIALHEVESMRGFDWENQRIDWESACAALAGVISEGRAVKDWQPLAVKAVTGQPL